MKQYITFPAYTDNYHVVCVDDGKITNDKIVSYYNLPGYIESIEDQGYEKAYFVPAAKKDLERAKQTYLMAQEAYDTAIANALEISDEEASKNIHLAEALKPDDWDDFT